MTNNLNREWPDGKERTDEDERKTGTQFSVSFSRTERELSDEMDRLNVDWWNLFHERGSVGDPGVVLRWEKGGVQYAVVCDGYKEKSSNLRDVYLWVNETRMRMQRETETMADSFAAAQLPPGEQTDDDDPLGGREPWEVLGVQPDTSDEIVETVARKLKAHHHPDGKEPDEEEWKAVKEAERRMLE